jgi:hypothetical protein
MMILIAILKGSGLKSILSLIISSASTAAKRGTKPLTVGLSKRLRNYNKSANPTEMETLVQTLHKWRS